MPRRNSSGRKNRPPNSRYSRRVAYALHPLAETNETPHGGSVSSPKQPLSQVKDRNMRYENGTPPHDEVIAALMTSTTREEAASKLGVSRSTLYRWLQQDEELKEAFRSARSTALQEGTTTLQMASYEAAAALRSLVLDTNVNPHVRLGACRAILEYAYRATEVEDVRAQIEELKGLM
jgi:transposase-like protein